MFSKTELIGNVGVDPTMRYTTQGDAVLSFSVATNKSWLPEGSSEWKTKTTWWKVTAWRKSAEYLAEKLHKGVLVFVEGEVVPDERGGPKIWTAQDGTPRASFEISAKTVRILERTQKGEQAAESTDAVTDLEM